MIEDSLNNIGNVIPAKAVVPAYPPDPFSRPTACYTAAPLQVEPWPAVQA